MVEVGPDDVVGRIDAPVAEHVGRLAQHETRVRRIAAVVDQVARIAGREPLLGLFIPPVQPQALFASSHPPVG